MLCPRCQTAIAEGARSCTRCGMTLLAAGASPAERRQLTVLFCDLVDSTALSVRLDPEDLREIMRAYRKYVGDTESGVSDGWGMRASLRGRLPLLESFYTRPKSLRR